MLNLPLLAHRRARDDIIDMYKHFHSFDKVIKKKLKPLTKWRLPAQN